MHDASDSGSQEAEDIRTLRNFLQSLGSSARIIAGPPMSICSTPRGQREGQVPQVVQRQMSFVPGLYKIFDEILVNATDNKVRDPTMVTLKVDIDAAEGVVRVFNDGNGIPVEMHKEEGVYVPELIFGHLLTSSNYDDGEKKVTGGRNGYGAKLAKSGAVLGNSIGPNEAAGDFDAVRVDDLWIISIDKRGIDVRVRLDGVSQVRRINFMGCVETFQDACEALDAIVAGKVWEGGNCEEP